MVHFLVSNFAESLLLCNEKILSCLFSVIAVCEVVVFLFCFVLCCLVVLGVVVVVVVVCSL